jgi:DNA-directed RNA polymerase specialized sigma24 family protein
MGGRGERCDDFPGSVPKGIMVKYPTIGTDTTNRDGSFASTSWTVVFEAARSQASSSQALSALSELCALYWRPLYLFLRREGFNSDDAQDLTQGFFAHLIETRAYTRAQPAKGRFRSFLLGALKHFVAHARDRDRAKKRGGGTICLPITDATIVEVEAQTNYVETWSADHVYEREWAAALLRRALDRLGQECALAGKSALFDCLKFHLSGTNETAVAYEEVSGRLGRPTATLRSDVARLRARYRAILREEVCGTVEEASQVDDELRYLCQVMAA